MDNNTWTLPSNVALAVNKEIIYCLVESGNEKYILAKSRLEILKDLKTGIKFLKNLKVMILSI